MRIQSDSWPTNQPSQAHSPAQPSPAQSGLIGQHLTSLDSGPLPKFNYHWSFYLCIKYSNLYFWCVDESFRFQKLIYHHEERKEGWKVVLMNIIIFYSKKLWKEIWYLIFTRPLPAPASGPPRTGYMDTGQFGRPHENFAQSVSIFWRTFLNSSFWRISVTQLGTARCPDPGLMVSPSFTSFSFSLSVSLSPFTCWHGRGLSTGPLLLQWHKSSVSQW